MSAGKKGIPVWVWVAALIPVSLVCLLMLSALAMYGVRQYMTDAKEVEAKEALNAWGKGILRCAQRDGHLPPSSSPVPGSLDFAGRGKYQSTPSDWNQPAHTCAGFALSEPQYFQYRWTLRTPNEGTLRAEADLDVNGAADAVWEVRVVCSDMTCMGSVPVRVAGADERTLSAESTLRRHSLAVPLGGLAVLVGSIWLIVAGFSVSVPWGIVVWFVPCSSFVFAAQHWDRAKRPALLLWGGVAISALGVAWNPLVPPDSKPAAEQASSPAPPSPLTATPAAPTATPLPTPAALPLTGEPADLSSVMGRARKLANAWQPDATLLGVEATLLDGKIQTGAGATAKVSFGPSRFGDAPARPASFVVTYDRSGIKGTPLKAAAGKALPEPMCAPEGVLPRLDEFKGSPLTLRYGLDGSQRPAWLMSLPGDPKPLRAFAPEDCSPRGTFVARPRR